MAEVKVRITAQNETQTGFQSALNNAKKFGAEASRAASVSMPAPATGASSLTMSAKPEAPPELQELLDQLRAARELARQPIDIAVDGAPEAAATSSRLSQSIRGLAGDLLNANSAGDVFGAVINRLTTAFGGLIAAAAGFAIGRVIAAQIDQATASIENLNSLAGRLNESLNSLNAPNVTFDQLGSSVAAVTANVNALKAANEEMQGSFRNQTIDAAFKALGMLGTLPQLPASGPLGLIGGGVNALGLGNGFLSAANEEVDSAAAAARADVAVKIKQLTADEIALSKTRTEEERKLLQLQQERAQLRITVGVAGGAKALAELEKLFAAQDASETQIKADKQFKGQIEKDPQLADKIAKVALQATGLEDLEELKSAIEGTNDKNVAIALTATGFSTVEELRAALDGTNGKTLQLALEATGLPGLQSLQAALAATDSKTIELALRATGLQNAQQLAAAIEVATQAAEQNFQKQQQLFTKAAQLRAANAETRATQGLSDSELLARNQSKIAALDEKALQTGMSSNEDQVEREAILQNILGLEERIKSTREAAQKSLADAIQDREFSALSPSQQQYAIDRDSQNLLSDIENGRVSAAEASQRALELASRQDALASSGFQGSSGASAFQRVGLATNEFFDTRKPKDPASAIEKGNKLLQDIKQALSKGEPLVLNPTST